MQLGLGKRYNVLETRWGATVAIYFAARYVFTIAFFSWRAYSFPLREWAPSSLREGRTIGVWWGRRRYYELWRNEVGKASGKRRAISEGRAASLLLSPHAKSENKYFWAPFPRDFAAPDLGQNGPKSENERSLHKAKWSANSRFRRVGKQSQTEPNESCDKH